jgi:steroid delta-isomerase-like uncharacterized protein
MSDKAKELVADLQKAWNEKDWDKLEALHTDNWIEHNLPDGMNDLSGLKGTFDVFTTAFPDLEFKPINIISDGTYVSSQYEITGTHTGEFMGIPAMGRTIKFRGMTQLIMQEGKCAQAWTILDQLTLMQQIGAIPVAQ